MYRSRAPLAPMGRSCDMREQYTSVGIWICRRWLYERQRIRYIEKCHIGSSPKFDTSYNFGHPHLRARSVLGDAGATISRGFPGGVCDIPSRRSRLYFIGGSPGAPAAFGTSSILAISLRLSLYVTVNSSPSGVSGPTPRYGPKILVRRTIASRDVMRCVVFPPHLLS